MILKHQLNILQSPINPALVVTIRLTADIHWHIWHRVDHFGNDFPAFGVNLPKIVCTTKRVTNQFAIRNSQFAINNTPRMNAFAGILILRILFLFIIEIRGFDSKVNQSSITSLDRELRSRKLRIVLVSAPVDICCVVTVGNVFQGVNFSKLSL